MKKIMTQKERKKESEGRPDVGWLVLLHLSLALEIRSAKKKKDMITPQEEAERERVQAKWYSISYIGLRGEIITEK